MNRVYHTWDKWECYKAGFFDTNPSDKSLKVADCEEMYRAFLSDDATFRVGLDRVLKEWKNSCEHNLSNDSMNRIAWLGQAAMCIEKGIPSRHRAGYNLLDEAQKTRANLTALEYLNKWLVANGGEELPTLDLAEPATKSVKY